ncbi:MAG: FHA domain-containing protein [Myxococcales bacterium]|jgi:hypothetical protein
MDSLMPHDIERHLLPSGLVAMLRTRSLEAVEREVPSGYAAIIRVPNAVDPLAIELAQIYGVEKETEASPQVMEFHTQLARADDVPTMTPRDGADVSQEMHAARRYVMTQACFAVPLAKRGVGTMTENITVGRALNKDLVLRAQGVSKLHAWFEIGSGGVSVCDAGSKNGTFVAGTRIPPREPTRTSPGEIITFSTIEVMLCHVPTLWHLVRG